MNRVTTCLESCKTWCIWCCSALSYTFISVVFVIILLIISRRDNDYHNMGRCAARTLGNVMWSLNHNHITLLLFFRFI